MPSKELLKALEVNVIKHMQAMFLIEHNGGGGKFIYQHPTLPFPVSGYPISNFTFFPPFYKQTQFSPSLKTTTHSPNQINRTLYSSFPSSYSALGQILKRIAHVLYVDFLTFSLCLNPLESSSCPNP